jgi:D-2-hydroxyacid dehydrogenase (NADP+)
MKPCNVLVTGFDIGRITEESLIKINSVDPRVRARTAEELVFEERHGDLSEREKLSRLLAETEIIFGSGSRLPQDVIHRAPNLRWIHLMGAGADKLANMEFWKSPIILTNSKGISATPLAEFVVCVMLMFVTRAPLCFELKQKKQWTRFLRTDLHDKTVGIVGLGAIGQEVARLSKAMGMRVLAMRRSSLSGEQVPHVDVMFSKEQLKQLLAESDFVVLTLPLTPETQGLIGEDQLRAMKTTAYIINISRGKIINEEALIRALQSNTIAGAGLEAFSNEPLPPDNTLWDLPNVIFNPHCGGGNREDQQTRMTDLFCENLKRYLCGENMINVIDKVKGY